MLVQWTSDLHLLHISTNILGPKIHYIKYFFFLFAEKDHFECTQCDRCFSSAKLTMRHIRCEHHVFKVTDLIPVVSWKLQGKRDGSNNVRVSKSTTKVAASRPRDKVAPSQPRDGSVDQGTGGKTFFCVVCGKSFSSQGRLEAHSMFHESSEDHTCPICGDKQKNGYRLAKHMANHEQLSHKCSACNKMYQSRGAVMRHERVAHGIQVVRDHKCRFCEVEFAKKEDCKKHEKTHKEYYARGRRLMLVRPNHDDSIPTKQAPVKLTERNAGDFNAQTKRRARKQKKPRVSIQVPPDEPKDMLGKAADYYILPRPYKCSYCPQRYVEKAAVHVHEKEVHEGRGKYCCTNCSKVFVTEARYLDHMKTHEEHRLFRCTLCPRSFASEMALSNHQGEHTGLKPFKCDVCGRGFRVNKAMYQHKRRMHQERKMRFFCSFCNKGFADKGGLTKHEYRHKGIRPFVCMECGKAFTVKYSLQLHVRNVHEHKRPHACPICGKTFALNHCFTYHMFRHKVQGDTQSPDEVQQTTGGNVSQLQV